MRENKLLQAFPSFYPYSKLAKAIEAM